MRRELHRLLMSSALIQAVGLFLTLLIGVQLARYLGPTGYGVYGVAMAVVSIAMVIAQFGLPLLGTREAARALSPGSTFSLGAAVKWFALRSIAVASLVGLALLAGVLIIQPDWIAGQASIALLAAGLTIASAIVAVAVAMLRGAGRNLEGQGLDLVVRPALTAAMLLLAYQSMAGLTVADAFAVQTAAVLATLAIAVAMLAKACAADVKRDAGRFHPERWTATSMSFTSNALLGALNGNYPILIAGLFVAGPDLGILRVAIASAVLVGLPSAVANIAVIPLIARHSADGNKAALRAVLSHTTIACFAATLAVLLLLLVAGRPLIAILFGPVYVDAHGPLMILAAGQLVIASFGIAGSYFNLTGRETLVTRAFAIAVPLGIATSVWLTKVIGISGAAAGTVVMAVAWHAYIFAARRREVDMPLWLMAAIRHVRTKDEVK